MTGFYASEAVAVVVVIVIMWLGRPPCDRQVASFTAGRALLDG